MLSRARLPGERDQRQGLGWQAFLRGSERVEVGRAEQGPQETTTWQSGAGWGGVAKSTPAVAQAWGREGPRQLPGSDAVYNISVT